jgi:hypothetical protein
MVNNILKISLWLICMFAIALFCACEKKQRCFMSSGDPISYSVDLENFDTIYVFSGIALNLKMGSTYKATIETRANLDNYLDIEVKQNTLTLRNNVGCNLARGFGETTITLELPNLELIRSYTEQPIKSLDTLTFPTFRIAANENNQGAGTGDITLTINNTLMSVESNTVTRFFISGQTGRTYIGFFGGVPKFEGEHLRSNIFQFFHRGAGNINCNPINRIEGNIFASGNVIANQRPPIVEVNELNSGRLIFRE